MNWAAVLLALPLAAAQADPHLILWQDPGPVAKLDFSKAAAGRATAVPQPPFEFLREELGGTSPKVIVKDAKGVEWRVKGGLETRPEAFSTRIVAAMGFCVEPAYFVARGAISGVRLPLKRAGGFLNSDGSFTYVTFEPIDPNVRFIKDSAWSWQDSPFKGTREMNGLKILVMLLSNWDNKDRRDESKGSNTAVIETIAPGSPPKRCHMVTDWGQTLGAWGRYWNLFGGRKPWDCEAFSREILVTGLHGDEVQFGYAGQHTDDFKAGITVADVEWLLVRLGEVTDDQLRTALRSSGANAAEEQCYVRSLRARINQLRNIVAKASRQRAVPVQ